MPKEFQRCTPGTDAGLELVHTERGTAANVADVNCGKSFDIGFHHYPGFLCAFMYSRSAALMRL